MAKIVLNVLKTGNSRGIQCSGICKSFYHAKCAEINSELFNAVKSGSVSWKCKTCPSNAKVSMVILAEGDDTETESHHTLINSEESAVEKLSTFDLSDCSMDNMGKYCQALGSVVVEIHKSNLQELNTL